MADFVNKLQSYIFAVKQLGKMEVQEQGTEAEKTAKIIKSVAISLGLKTYELAEKLGVNRQQMYDYTMGKKVPKWPFWVNLKQQFPQLSGDYLLTGNGSILA